MCNVCNVSNVCNVCEMSGMREEERVHFFVDHNREYDHSDLRCVGDESGYVVSVMRIV